MPLNKYWTNRSSLPDREEKKSRGLDLILLIVTSRIRECGRQFIEFYKPPGYDRKIKEQCLQMYVNGMGFRAIERVMGVHHTTVISWVKKIGNKIVVKITSVS